nr:Eco57I restriction-modification methylase domain-containing protein [uncultured Methanolobus sp.]
MDDLDIPKKEENESLVSYAVRISDFFRQFYDYDYRKVRGQFFTPENVACYMASFIDIDRNETRILDPGAGSGILIAAVCDRIVTECMGPMNLIVDCYENDPSMLSLLKEVLDNCKTELKNKSHIFEYEIYEQDFILHNTKYLNKSLIPPWEEKELIFYNSIISNPPYYKINKDSPQSIAMKCQDYGHTNVYASFMALSIKMLKKNGEMIFITPRSFCSGFYYQKFRKWLVKSISLEHIHLFDSRKDIFSNDGVLQENIIFKVNKRKQEHNVKIKITSSNGKDFKSMSAINVEPKYVIHHHKSDALIRIPTSNEDAKILDELDNWPNTLKDLGLDISTGPVVPFRTKEYLCDCSDAPNEAPLLWIHNLVGFDVKWPVFKKNKEKCIEINPKSEKILLSVKNYVLLKRVSSKEQKRRIYAAVLKKSDFKKYKHIGIENHLNYIYKINGELTKEEAYGIAAILNCSILDRYFRCLNGHTQVNANDIKNIRLPSINVIKKIGHAAIKSTSLCDSELDNIVMNNLGNN